ncbi:MAG: hypothetical protein IT352_15415 [Gemmatimonadales bacterium]|nr:hypothetical protein [Gemmatimonadales bacterium]
MGKRKGAKRPTNAAIRKAFRKRARQLRRDAYGRWIERRTRPPKRRA